MEAKSVPKYPQSLQLSPKEPQQGPKRNPKWARGRLLRRREVPGGPVSGEGEGGDGPGRDIENDEGTAHVEDDEGDIPGKRVERRSKGIRIIPTEEFPNEKEQAWVDLPRGAVVINILHPFYIFYP